MLSVRPLSLTFAAEFLGLHLSQPVDDQIDNALAQAFAAHPVLIFTEQDVDDDQPIAFSKMFGALETTKPGTVGTGSKVVVLSNFDSDGNIVTASHRQILNGRANQQWHTDSSFKKISAKASVLSASVIPDAGGQTEFICMRTVYRNLPNAMVLDHGPWGR